MADGSFDGKQWLASLTPEQNTAINDIVAKHKGEVEVKAKATADTLNSQIAEIQAERDKVLAQVTEEKKSKMTAEEKSVSEMQSIRAELTSLKDERDRLATERQNEMVSAELTRAISKFKPRNLDHVMSLVRSKVSVNEGKITLDGQDTETGIKALRDSKDTSYLFEGDKVAGTGIMATPAPFAMKPDLDNAIRQLVPK